MAYQSLIETLSSTVHRDTIINPVVENFIQPFRNSLSDFPWKVTGANLQLANQLGINVSSFGAIPHPHPFHKTLESNLLRHHWNFNARNLSTVMYMKPEKFHKLQQLNSNFSELINFRHEPKDVTRYPESIAKYPTTQTVFMHDSLMFFSPSQILDLFLHSPNLEQLFASLVVPAESFFRLPSLFPNVYRIEYFGDQIKYFLEGNSTGCYTQPHQAVQWLELSHIVGPDFTLTITILESWVSQHSVLITRGHSPSATSRCFLTPPSVLIPPPTGCEIPLSARLVPQEVYAAIFNYVRAVRTLRTTDPTGFIRTQRNKPEYNWVQASAWDNLAHFALHTCTSRPSLDYDYSLSPFARFLQRCNSLVRKYSHGFWACLSTLPMLFFQFAPFKIEACLRCYDRQIFGEAPFDIPYHFQQLIPPNRFHQFIRFVASFFTDKDLFPILSYTRCVYDQPYHMIGLGACSNDSLMTRFLSLHKIALRHPFATLISVSLLAHVCHRFYKSTHTPQQLNDSYLSYFHPSPWLLEIPCREVDVGVAPFFSNCVETESQSDTASVISETPPANLPPTELPTSISLETTVFPDPEPFRPLSPPFPPLPLRGSNSSTLSSSFRRLQDELFDGLSLSETPKDRHALPLPESPIPDPTIPPESGQLFFSSVATCSGPTLPEPTPIPTPQCVLLQDPSATGPVLTYRTLSGKNMAPGEGEFLTRRRFGTNYPPYPTLDCLLSALGSYLIWDPESLWETLCSLLPNCLLNGPDELSGGLSTDHLLVLCWWHNFRAIVHSEYGTIIFGPESNQIVHLAHVSGSPGHWKLSQPLPIEPTHPASTSSFARVALSFRDPHGFLLPFRHIHEYKPSSGRAKNLSSNMKNEFDGILSQLFRLNPNMDSGFFRQLDNRADFASTRTVQLIHLSGFPGCGKSFPVSRLLRSSTFSSKFRVSVPTTDLREEWKQMLSLRSSENWRVGTWESSLTKNSEVLVIDEVYKMPNGYLDLCLIADPSISFVILLGDPCQSSYVSLSPDSSNSRLSNEIDHLSPYRDLHCMWTRRLPKKIASLFGVTTYNPEEGFIIHKSTPNRKNPLLTASINSSKIFRGNGITASTFNASQGVTHKKSTQLYIDRHIRMLHPSTSFVAVTRSRKGIVFTGDFNILTRDPGCNFVFENVFTNKPIDLTSLFQRELQHTELIYEPITSRSQKLRGGSSFSSLNNRFHRQTNFLFDPNHVRKPRLPSSKPLTSQFREDVILEADPVSDYGSPIIPQVDTTFLPETRRPLHSDLPSALASSTTVSPSELSSCAIETVYPGYDYELLLQQLIPPHDPRDREIRFGSDFSNQFPWLNKEFDFGTQAPSLISPIHDSKNDPTLLLASIQKRLRFRSSASAYKVSPSDEALGLLLYESLCRAYRRNPNHIEPFNPTLFADCINLNEYSQLTSKTQSVIMANASRSDPDWRHTVVRIFSKTQHKINEGSIFGSWKACQTLALLHDAIVLLFGPIKKYQRVFDSQDRPPNLFVYGGHTPFELSRQAQQQLSPGALHLCNDYTSFDQSQQGEAVVLERLKMLRLSIPQNLVDLHVSIKTSLSSQFGPLTCMRLTGEPGTYDDNTDYNIAVIYSEYDIGNESVFVSGDDSLISPEPLPHPLWPTIAPLLHLGFKKERTTYGLFCGYYLGAAGAVRSPRPLLAKIGVALADGSISDKKASYLSEFVVGHSLGDEVWTLIPLEQVEHQSALFDFFCRNCNQEQKLTLKLGEVPDSMCASLLALGAKWISQPLFALLNRVTRLRLLSSSPNRLTVYHDDPELQGVLLQHL
uniref:Replicase n=1 Tax=Nasturtium officinale macula-like virus 1 TaxID=2794440 RepID=A0A7T5QZD4_9VIRU|nr:replicase [Nasturtium officinale macula-like virus 1]